MVIPDSLTTTGYFYNTITPAMLQIFAQFGPKGQLSLKSCHIWLQLAHLSATVALALSLIFAWLSKFIYITHRNETFTEASGNPVFRRTFPSLQGV